MARFAIRNVTKILQSASGRLFGRLTAGDGPGEELTGAQARSLCSVYSTSEVDAIAAAKVSAASLALGTTGSDLNWSGVTLNVPNAGASARGVVTTGTQTFAGDKTFSGNVVMLPSPNGTLVGINAVATGADLCVGNAGISSIGSVACSKASNSISFANAAFNLASWAWLQLTSSYDMVFATYSAGEQVRIAQGGGISFLGSVSCSAALNFPPITKSALLALTPTASTAGRWRVTDATPASREAYPDGTNWRYTSDDTIVV